MNESNYRQKLLILYLGNASLNSDVVGWSLYDGTTDEDLDLGRQYVPMEKCKKYNVDLNKRISNHK